MNEAQDNRPNIRCPCCEEIFDARKLAPRRIERNKYGIDIFACINCNERIKIDPYEYAGVSEMMACGDTPSGVAIEAYKNGQLMPCEKEAQKEDGWFSRLFRR